MTASHLVFVDALAVKHMARARSLGARRCPCGDRPDACRRVVAADAVAVWFWGCA